MKISKISVPFGVIGVIYEARPNVTFDVFSLCLKSGNACILKGGSDAINSNKAIVGIIRNQFLKKMELTRILLLSCQEIAKKPAQLLNAREYVDLIIPEGKQKPD